MDNKSSVDSVKTKALVQHRSSLNEDISSLYEKESYTDVTFRIEDNSIRCHKVIMATRSEYFKALLYGGLRESHEDEIVLCETPFLAFKLLLKYIYTGEVNLKSIEHSLLLDVLGIVHTYGFEKLESAISEYLIDTVDIRNAFITYKKISNYNLSTLSEKCLTLMDENPLDVIRSETFMSLSAPSLKEIIRRDSFFAPEVEIFSAVSDWIQRNPCIETQDIWSYVRFSVMTLNQILDIVRPSGNFCADAVLDIVQKRTEQSENVLIQRACLIPEENVATEELQAKVLSGEKTSTLLNGMYHNYNSQNGFTSHVINSQDTQGIEVRLGMKYLINRIRVLLWDLDLRSYSYYIEVSLDYCEWVRIIDHTKYPCRSWQNLYFEARPVRYVRIVGTSSTANNYLQVVAFECMYTKKPFHLVDGLLSPLFNVATKAYGACVIEGEKTSALLNGQTKTYNETVGYTWHEIGKKYIAIQLSQPYMLQSMRILLWDRDNRYYSYYVSISADNCQWYTIADKRNDLCQSWQLINFSLRPVLFIRIIGTANTANNGFHCVHLECPAETGLPERQEGETNLDST